jgi:predicted GNAT family N-acyltransferase
MIKWLPCILPYFIPLNSLEATSVHVLFSLSSHPTEYIGTLRYNPAKTKVSRILLLPPYRQLGIGKCMMVSFERRLLTGLALLDQDTPSSLDFNTPREIRLHSQMPVIGFYSKIGYQPVGPTFIGKSLHTITSPVPIGNVTQLGSGMLNST